MLKEQSLNFGLLRKEIYQKSIQNLIMFRNDIFKGHTDSTEITDYFVSTLITINRPLIYHQFISEHGSLEFTRIYYYVLTNRRSKQEQNQTCLSFTLQGGGRQQVSRDI